MHYTQNAEKFLLHNAWTCIILVNSRKIAALFAPIIVPSIRNNACIRNITRYTLDVSHINVASSPEKFSFRVYLTLNEKKKS